MSPVDLGASADDLPLALRRLQLDTPVGATLRIRTVLDDADWFADALAGAGFEATPPRRRTGWLAASGTRIRSLADTVAPGMRVLVVGLNPSLHAADAGIGFVTPGNRFWPAALAAGLASRDRDPDHALVHHGVGMTDLVKRATPRADALTTREYREGVDRLDRLCTRYRPGVVAFVGLAGWRAAIDRRAAAGPQDRDVGGRPVYLLPSTSGLNAGTRLDDHITHLRAALAHGET